MPIRIELIIPEYAMSQEAVRNFVVEQFEGYDMEDGLVFADTLTDDEVPALAAEDLLKSHGIPYDLKIEDEVGSNHSFYRPGEEDVVVRQSWGVSSIDPIELTQLIAETSDANLREAIMQKIKQCLASQVEPLENLVAANNPLQFHEDVTASVH